VDNKHKFSDLIQDFFKNKIKDKVKLENYIIDFAIVEGRGEEDRKVVVIELNPWKHTTDSCLFSWFKDADQLHNGPLEFRFDHLVGSTQSQNRILNMKWCLLGFRSFHK
jgi:hypothetical protein